MNAQNEEWISITEAARRLSALGDQVERSTLSRYLKQHSEALPLRVEGKASLVEFSALREHRKENIRIASMPIELRPQTGNHSQPSRFPNSRADGAARKAVADAEIREMELEERRKNLTPSMEVDAAGRDAVALMQSAFERAVEPSAATANVKYGWDERTARIVLKSFMRTGLEVFNRLILERLDSSSQGDEQEA